MDNNKQQNELIQKILNNNIKYGLDFEDALYDIIVFSNISYVEISHFTNIPIKILKNISKYYVYEDEFDLLIKLFNLNKENTLANFCINIINRENLYKLTKQQIELVDKGKNAFHFKSIESLINNFYRVYDLDSLSPFTQSSQESTLVKYILTYLIKYEVLKRSNINFNLNIQLIIEQIELILKWVFEFKNIKINDKIIYYFNKIDKNLIKFKDDIFIDYDFFEKIKRIYKKEFNLAITISV